MPSTSAELRRASATAPKSFRLDSHHQHRLEQKDQQERHTGTSPSQAPLESTQIRSILPSSTRTNQSMDLMPSQLLTRKTWKRGRCEHCDGRQALHRVAQPTTPAEIQSNLRKAKKTYRQFLQALDDRVRDKEVRETGAVVGR
jgi:hypothetical protein